MNEWKGSVRRTDDACAVGGSKSSARGEFLFQLSPLLLSHSYFICFISVSREKQKERMGVREREREWKGALCFSKGEVKSESETSL